jgi:DNA-binding transcriptional MerR regulator
MPAQRTGKRLKMRDLERATGVGREAIRYYIREGLLPEPERTARNVAWYDESFVERVSLIKKLQKERYLPLAVIKGIVGAERALSADETRMLLELDGKIVPAADRGGGRRSEQLSTLARRTDLRAAELRELAQVGLVEIVTRDGAQWLEGNAIEIVELWARMRRAGFADALGFGPQALTIYVQFVDWLAREEIRVFTSCVTGKVTPEISRDMAEEGITCVNRMVGLMRETTLLRYIARGNLDAPAQENSQDTAS